MRTPFAFSQAFVYDASSRDSFAAAAGLLRRVVEGGHPPPCVAGA